MKKTLLIMLFAILGTQLPLLSADFSSDGIFYKKITGKKHELEVSYNYYKGDVVIPSTVVHKGITYKVTSIGKEAFHSCIAMTSVSIPNSITSIDNNAFYGCRLRSVTIPNSVISIGDAAFQNCSQLTSINIPNSVISVGANAFQDCRDLTSVSIGNSTSSIGNSVFDGCVNLTSISIPSSVTYIGKKAFQECSSLIEIKCVNPVPPKCAYDAFSNATRETAVLYVPEGSLSAYKNDETWKEFFNIR